MVVLFRVDCVFPEHVSGVGDHGGMVAVDQADDLGSGMSASDAEVAQLAGIPQGDAA